MKIGSMAISIKGLNKAYNGSPVISELNLNVRKGKKVAVYGPNGVGKTTLFNILGGSDNSYKGEVICAGTKPRMQNCSRVFQDSSNTLFPWMNIRKNIEFPIAYLREDKRTVSELKNQVDNAMASLDLHRYSDFYPYQVSGGIKQRTCIARAIVRKADILLLDEPFSGLDYESTWKILQRFSDLWDSIDTTTLIISHQPDHAIYLADQVLIMTGDSVCPYQLLDIEFERPRPLSIVLEEKFDIYRRNLLTQSVVGKTNENS